MADGLKMEHFRIKHFTVITLYRQFRLICLFFNIFSEYFGTVLCYFLRKQLFNHDMNLILAEKQCCFAWLAVLLSSHTPTDMHLICHQHLKTYLNIAKTLWVNVLHWHTSSAQKPAILQTGLIGTSLLRQIRMHSKIKRINNVKMTWHIKTCWPWYIITIW